MNMWSLSDVKKYFPCCTEAVEKYFKEAKKETIGQDKLAEIIAQVRVKQYTEAGANAEPECPPEFKWNEELSRCVESSGAPDTTGSRQVCPKGMKWDDKTQKCVVVTAEAAQTPPAPASTQPAEMPDDEWLNGIGKKKLEEMTDDEKKKSVKIIGEKIKTLTAEEQEKIKKVELQANPGDGRPPKEWWNRCVAGPGAGATDPASYCGFLWHKVVVEKGATPASVAAEPPATPAATTAPTVTTSEEDKKKIESLAEQVKKLENEKKAEAIKKLKDDNRNILLPKFDDQIDMIFKEIDSQKLIKFGETETSLFDLFYGLLKDISKNKAVIFAEMVKTPGEGTEMKLTEDDNKQIEKNKTRYAEIKPGEAIENDELAIFAEKIAEQQKISYTEALVQASKLLRERK